MLVKSINNRVQDVSQWTYIFIEHKVNVKICKFRDTPCSRIIVCILFHKRRYKRNIYFFYLVIRRTTYLKRTQSCNYYLLLTCVFDRLWLTKMLAKILIVCVAFVSTCIACEDTRFKPLATVKTSLKWAQDDFTITVFGDPDKYIPHSMYIGKSWYAHVWSKVRGPCSNSRLAVFFTSKFQRNIFWRLSNHGHKLW